MTKNIYKAKKGQLNSRAAGLGDELGFRFDQWNADLDKLFTALGENPVIFAQLFEGMAGKLYANIVESTPVATSQARTSWRINKEKDTDTEISFKIVNGVPYIVFLEYGSSKQAPKGMVRVNLDKFIKDTQTLTRRLAKSGRFTK